MTKTTNDKDRQLAVRQAQQQFWTALQNKDKQSFEYLVADDFIQRSPGQPNQDRTTFIDTLTSFPGRVRSVGSDDLEVHLWGEIAVVTGLQLAEIELANGQVMHNRIAITNIFQEQQGGWVLKLAHAVSLE
jgi:ketosteroid isomerase-like protein